MRFTEAELTAAMAGVAKAALAAQLKKSGQRKVDVEQAWVELGGYGRYQLIEPMSTQVLPVLIALPDVPRTVGERPAYKTKQIKAVVEEQTPDDGSGRIRRAALVLARVALVSTALASIPPWTDPESIEIPDSLG